MAGGDAPQPADDPGIRLTQEIRASGRLPKRVQGTNAETTAERNLASRLRKARAAGRITAEQEAELAALREQGYASQLVDEQTIGLLMQEIRAFGRLPQAVQGTDAERTAERNLAQRLRKARAAGRVTAEQEAKLASMAGQLADEQTIGLMQEIRAFG